jgi:RNA polymerase sigma factor (sigma-70 family)
MQPLKQAAPAIRVEDEPEPATSVDRLYRSHGRWLLGALRRRFGAALADVAEDLVQETYLRLTPRSANTPVQSPRALLMRIASNLAFDHLRRRKVDARALAQLDRPLAPSPHQIAHPLAAIELRELILALPEPLKDVFVLSRFGGLTYAEIAHHLGLSVKTVEWRMSKALALCAERLRGERP